MDKKNNKKGYIIPHTHWDREWRYPLWKNRMLLVEFMEELLAILDNDPDYRCFLLDGQVVPIEDYLEVAPEKKEKVCKYIEEGRIAVGPWYTLPDLYPVAGECLVRNLLKGIRLSEEYGGCQGVAYNSFGWGQIAQFPQIYKEFGFDFIIAAKKVSKKRAPESEFMWEAPDGSRVLTSRMGKYARANFFFHAYIRTRYGVDFLSDEFEYSPDRCGLAYHKANPEDCNQDYFLIEPARTYYPEYIKKGIEDAWDATEETVVKDHRLFLNGCDFSTPQPDLTKIIKDANKMFSDKEFKSARLEEYTEKVKETIEPEELNVVKGELRDGPASKCSGNALASRIHIKQLNKKVQNIILKKTEPFASILSMKGQDYPQKFLNKAWEYLLKSHPHDSINGVTQDKTVDDVTYRLHQAEEISKVVYDKTTGEIIKQIDLSNYKPDDLLLIVFNPISAPVKEVIEVCIDTPRKEEIWNFKMVDCDGNNVEIQHVSRQEKVVPVHDMDARPWPNYVDRHTCYLECEIPAAGYKVLKVVPEEEFNRDHYYWLPMRKTKGEEISRVDNTLENEYLKVEVNSNGTIDLLDKVTERQYTNLHYFQDSGDVGNYWAYYPPYHNKIYNTLGCNAEIWCEDNGPLSATLGIELRMEIPAAAHEPEHGVQGKSKRSEEKTTLKITSRLTLKKGAKRVDIKTTVNNTARNHRLRVAFPAGIRTEYSHASGHFTVDKRPITPPGDKEGKHYPEMQTLPMQHFVDINDDSQGLAVLSDSFTEYELKDNKDSTLYLTLFRSMGNMIVTEWRSVGRFPEQDGSQLLQELEYEYSIYPHQGDWEQGKVYHEAEKANISLTPIQVSQHNNGKLPEQKSFFSIEPDNLILSAFKKAEDRDSYIIRLFNPASKKIKGKIKLFQPVDRVYKTNLNEERESEIKLVNNKIIPVIAGSNKIITVEILL